LDLPDGTCVSDSTSKPAAAPVVVGDPLGADGTQPIGARPFGGHNSDSSRNADLDGLAECAPTTNADVAKASVWSSAAGFVEMVFPNVISTLNRSVATSDD
jgi:hypothetical protein